MPEIRFYHTQYKSAQEVLPDLLLKALQRNMRVACKLADPESCQDYDQYLWQFSKDHFLPHGMDTDDHVGDQPVILTTQDQALNGARTLMVLDEANLPPMDAPFDLICYIFDGRNAFSVKRAREEWSRLKSLDGTTLTYWQQQDTGQWLNKA